MSLLSATFGYACGWASPSINLLTSDESPLPSGRITMEEASWISSSLSIGGLFGNIFYGFITNAFGRKSPLILIAIPTIVSIPIRTTHKELIRIENWHLLNIFYNSDKLDTHFICSKCVLLVCSENPCWFRWRRCHDYGSTFSERDIEWSVMTYFTLLFFIECKT